MTILLALFTILNWSEPGVGDRLALTQDIDLISVSFPSETVLRLDAIEAVSVPGAPLVLYRLTQEKCDNPKAQSEIEIVTPKGNADSSAVGVQLLEGCVWEIYVEQKDLLTPSFFKPAF